MLRNVMRVFQREKHASGSEPNHLITVVGKKLMKRAGLSGEVWLKEERKKHFALLTVDRTRNRLSIMTLALIGQELTDYAQRRCGIRLRGVYWHIDNDAHTTDDKWSEFGFGANGMSVEHMDIDKEADEVAKLIQEANRDGRDKRRGGQRA